VSPSKKILVSGPTGFVGTELIRSFSDKYSIDIVVRRSSSIESIQSLVHTIYYWDDLNSCTTQYHAVVHLAGLAHDTRSTRSAQEYIDINVGLTQTLLELCKRTKSAKLLFMSSIKALSDTGRSTPLEPAMPANPGSVYGQSKLKAEQLLTEYQGVTDIIILRPTLIYGPNFKGNLSKLTSMVDKGWPFPFGSYKNKRNLLYIENLLTILDNVMQSKDELKGIFHVADDEPISTWDLYRHIAEARNRTAKKIPIPTFCVRSLVKLFGIFPKSRVSSTLEKLLGNLEVSNTKMLKALNMATMPFETKDAIVKSFKP